MNKTQATVAFEQRILAGIGDDLSRWRAADYRPSGVYDKSADRGGARHNRRMKAARAYAELEIDWPAWLGHAATEMERRAGRRALLALAATGAIEVLTTPGGRLEGVRVIEPSENQA